MWRSPHPRARPGSRRAAVRGCTGRHAPPAAVAATAAARPAAVVALCMEELLKHPLKVKGLSQRRLGVRPWRESATDAAAATRTQLYRDSLRLAAYLAAKQNVPVAGIRDQARPCCRRAPCCSRLTRRAPRFVPRFARTPKKRTPPRLSSSANGASAAYAAGAAPLRRPCATRRVSNCLTQPTALPCFAAPDATTAPAARLQRGSRLA